MSVDCEAIGRLHSDASSRLHALPASQLAPYLCTHVDGGFSYRDGYLHGTWSLKTRVEYASGEYIDGRSVTARYWWIDGSLSVYREGSAYASTLCICWTSLGIRIYVGGDRDTLHDTLPDKYRYVWELMTRTVDI